MSNQIVSNSKWDMGTRQVVFGLYYKRIETWSRNEQQGFSGEVVFHWWAHRKKIRTNGSWYLWWVTLSLLIVISGFEPIFERWTPGWVLFCPTVEGTMSSHTSAYADTQGLYSLLPYWLMGSFLPRKQWLLMTFLVSVILRSLYQSNVTFVAVLPPVSFHQHQRVFHWKPQVPAVSLK
jgi:hypothetical protein